MKLEKPLSAVTIRNDADHLLKFCRTSLSIHTPPLSDGLSCGQKNEPGILWSRISCAETKQQQLGQCYKSHIRYAHSNRSGATSIGNGADCGYK